ncbi:hypothetical protein TNCV_4882261 [Trichonephila clavipes]|nr:hypothetical protein TNCV_4882261 [Trichonephila clavipes]
MGPHIIGMADTAVATPLDKTFNKIWMRIEPRRFQNCSGDKLEKFCQSQDGMELKKSFENHPVGGADVRKSKKQCIHNEQKTFTTLLHHMTTTTGEKTFQASDKSSNGRVQHVRMYGEYFSVPTYLMHRINTREISNILTTRSLPVLNLETEEAMGTSSAC